MSSVTVTPVAHPVFNEFDRFGLLLGLNRLDLERNPEYKWRLLDVFIHRASSTYHGLIYGITRELGLSLVKAIKITMPSNMALPAVVFEGTKCTLYENYVAETVHAEFDRLDKSQNVWTIQELVNAINATSFTAEVLPTGDPDARAMGLFKQSSVVQISGEDIEGKGSRIQLAHYPLIEGTVSVGGNLRQRVYSESQLVAEGQYYIDLDAGVILTTSNPAIGSRIRYKYWQNEFTVEYSPVIIHDIHNDSFQSTLFEPKGGNVYGRPTALGADVINELLSVYPYAWGK